MFTLFGWPISMHSIFSIWMMFIQFVVVIVVHVIAMWSRPLLRYLQLVSKWIQLKCFSFPISGRSSCFPCECVRWACYTIFAMVLIPNSFSSSNKQNSFSITYTRVDILVLKSLANIWSVAISISAVDCCFGIVSAVSYGWNGNGWIWVWHWHQTKQFK